MTSMRHSYLFAAMRGAGVVLALLLPILAPVSSSAIAAIACTLVVYNGLSKNIFWLPLATLVVFELMWGIPLGSYSLAYACVMVIYDSVGRVIAVSPWASREGWHGLDAALSIVSASMYAWVMLVFSTLIISYGYGYGHILIRLRMVAVDTWWMVPLWCNGMLVLMRRMHVPFYRPVIFGRE